MWLDFNKITLPVFEEYIQSHTSDKISTWRNYNVLLFYDSVEIFLSLRNVYNLLLCPFNARGLSPAYIMKTKADNDISLLSITPVTDRTFLCINVRFSRRVYFPQCVTTLVRGYSAYSHTMNRNLSRVYTDLSCTKERQGAKDRSDRIIILLSNKRTRKSPFE